MIFNRTLARDLRSKYESIAQIMNQALPELIANPARLAEVARRSPKPVTPSEMRTQLELEFMEIRTALQILRANKTIVFASQQAEVFKTVAREYAEALDYRLPFEEMFLQFTDPVNVQLGRERDALIGILYYQVEQTAELIAGAQQMIRLQKAVWNTELQIPPHMEVGMMGNAVVFVFADHNLRKLTWVGNPQNTFFETNEYSEIEQSWAELRNLAIACIGYINCENVYLHREGDVSAAVNAKRERKGKAKLEPYYTCRIRGVDYDGPVAKGTGVEHGFRYDVRGHFRRMDTGKVTWVRPHQRGLKHELYIPKVYEVVRDVAPAGA